MSGHPTVSRSIPEISFGSHRDLFLNVYFTFLIIGGMVALPLLIVTVVFMKAVNRRHPTLINFLVLWTLYALSCLILLFSGQHKQESPRFDVCLLQASLIYGSISGGAVSTFCLVLQLWMDFRCQRICRNPRLSTGIILVLPWLFLSFFAIFAGATGAANRSIVTNKWVFYCTVTSNYIIYPVSAVGLVTVALVLSFQCLILRFLIKSGKVRSVDQPSYRLWLRVSVFTFFSVAALIIANLIVFTPTEPGPYLGFSLLPLITFLVFGTQKENLRMWFSLGCRRKPIRSKSEMMSIKVTVAHATDSDRAASAVKAAEAKLLPPIPHSLNGIQLV